METVIGNFKKILNNMNKFDLDMSLKKSEFIDKFPPIKDKKNVYTFCMMEQIN